MLPPNSKRSLVDRALQVAQAYNGFTTHLEREGRSMHPIPRWQIKPARNIAQRYIDKVSWHRVSRQDMMRRRKKRETRQPLTVDINPACEHLGHTLYYRLRELLSEHTLHGDAFLMPSPHPRLVLARLPGAEDADLSVLSSELETLVKKWCPDAELEIIPSTRSLRKYRGRLPVFLHSDEADALQCAHQYFLDYRSQFRQRFGNGFLGLVFKDGVIQEIAHGDHAIEVAEQSRRAFPAYASRLYVGGLEDRFEYLH